MPSPAMGTTGFSLISFAIRVKKPSPGPKMRLGRSTVYGTPLPIAACSPSHFVSRYG